MRNPGEDRKRRIVRGCRRGYMRRTPMKMSSVILLTLLWCLLAPGVEAEADVYVWEDENGVMNFTNYLPPPGASVFIKDMERPIEKAAAPSAPEMGKIEEKVIHEQEGLERKLEETSQKLEQVTEETQSLVQALEERVAMENQRANEAMLHARDLAGALSQALAERDSPSTAVYVESPGVVVYNVQQKEKSRHSGVHGEGFFDGGRSNTKVRKDIPRNDDRAGLFPGPNLEPLFGVTRPHPHYSFSLH